MLEAEQLAGGCGSRVAGGQGEQFQLLAAGAKQAEQLGGRDAVPAAVTSFKDEARRQTVAGKVDDVPSSPIFKRGPEALTGYAVLQGDEFNRLAAPGSDAVDHR